MAEAVLSAVFNALLEKMTSKVVDFFKHRKLNDEMLQRLEGRMNNVSGLLEDAEKKQIILEPVTKWLRDLKDVTFDAEDLLYKITNKTREIQHLEASPKTCSDQVRNFFSSLNPCKKGIGELQPELEKILARIEGLLQQEEIKRLLEKSDASKPRNPTTSRVNESCIYGRDDDKEAIIKLLLTDEDKLGVVPIVGMGGIGKTTLSQLVYKDSQVMQRFGKLKAWICVSEEFDIMKMTKNILKAIGSDCDSTLLDALQLQLEEEVRGKRILLVLDDVWNDNRADWELLLTPLESAAQGSKVLVTTRGEDVASVMSTVASYHLKELCKDDCWLLFAKYAFGGHDMDVAVDLKEIGRKIVRKCKGLPLAAKTIGSLLRSKRSPREWEMILKSNVWNLNDGTIIPALKLSYDYLPSHLKKCFSYCAMFPKDFKFRKEELILLWMAEGFIIQNYNESRELEDIGEEYFEDLCSRSFFQKHENYDKELCFVMHDLLNDLAKSIEGEYCYNNVDANSGKLTHKTRHLFYKIGDGSNALEEISKAKYLRTFICSIRVAEYRHVVDFLPRLGCLRALVLGGGSSFHLDSSVKHLRYMKLYGLTILNLPKTMPSLQTLIIVACLSLTSLPDSIGNMKDLRHLTLRMTGIGSLPDSIGNLKDLRHLTLTMIEIESLPDSIGNLKDLRHLDLCRTRIKSLPDSIGNLKDLRHLDLGYTSIERLPESVCGLHSLQHLSLSGCRLVELPAKMSDLVNLCHLDIRHTKLKSMPPQMGKLIKLQTLPYFIVGREKGSCIAELGHFRNLEGKLFLRDLQNVEDEQDALKAKIKDKSRLKKLKCVWEDDDNNSGNVDRSLLQHLEPHVNIKKISIGGYRGIDFPNWVGDSSFFNMVELSLNNCKHCTRLPPLGQLASLQFLEISGCDRLLSVGAEFYGSFNTIQPFRSLRTLFFNSMPKLQKWSCSENEIEEDDFTAFPLLDRLRIEDCPELEMMVMSHLFSLGSLAIEGCNKISSWHWDLRKSSSLSCFIIVKAKDMESFPGKILLPSTLPEIEIRWLQNLKSLDYAGLHHLTSLRSLIITRCFNLECIPDEGLPASLTKLYIAGCPLLEKRCRKEQGEDWPKISHIHNIDINIEEIRSTKIVLKLDIHDDKGKQKAMEAVSSFAGVDSISMEMKDLKLTVIGDIDPMDVVGKLRKLFFAEILTVGLVKEEKKEQEKKVNMTNPHLPSNEFKRDF